MGRREKEIRIRDLEDIKRKFDSCIFFDFRGMDVATLSKMRADVRKIGGNIRVVKNTFIKKVYGIRFEEPTAIAAIKQDIISLAKIVFSHTRNIKGGIIEGEGERDFISSEKLAELSKMGGLDGLRLRLVGSLSWGLLSLLFVMRAPYSSLVYVLSNREKNI